MEFDRPGWHLVPDNEAAVGSGSRIGAAAVELDRPWCHQESWMSQWTRNHGLQAVAVRSECQCLLRQRLVASAWDGEGRQLS